MIDSVWPAQPALSNPLRTSQYTDLHPFTCCAILLHVLPTSTRTGVSGDQRGLPTSPTFSAQVLLSAILQANVDLLCSCDPSDQLIEGLLILSYAPPMATDTRPSRAIDRFNAAMLAQAMTVARGYDQAVFRMSDELDWSILHEPWMNPIRHRLIMVSEQFRPSNSSWFSAYSRSGTAPRIGQHGELYPARLRFDQLISLCRVQMLSSTCFYRSKPAAAPIAELVDAESAIQLGLPDIAHLAFESELLGFIEPIYQGLAAVRGARIFEPGQHAQLMLRADRFVDQVYLWRQRVARANREILYQWTSASRPDSTQFRALPFSGSTHT